MHLLASVGLGPGCSTGQKCQVSHQAVCAGDPPHPQICPDPREETHSWDSVKQVVFEVSKLIKS